ncbi:AAA family ATPase [Legionella geestiana]|uniref:SPOR domain-containing protein n=1 Tax=Legionella geestiana TaxID=45065 RepID=UPI001091A03C|nr:AAA family ATPase [Legionella geestiana]QDQ39121.1 AAA family ATPase [Legionella geestiana]
MTQPQGMNHAGGLMQGAEVFKPASWMSCVNFINHLVAYNNVLIALMAEKNGGKSTFIGLLKGHLDARVRCVSVDAATASSHALLVEDFHKALGFDLACESGLDALVAEINRRQEPVLLLIDNAQELSDSLIETLLALLHQQGAQGCFHVCLAADTASMPSLNQLARGVFRDMIHTITLGPLSEAETRTYVSTRLAPPGNARNWDFDKPMAEFYALTRGNVAQINARAAAYFSKSPRRRTFLRPGNTGYALLLIMAMAAAFFWKAEVSQSRDAEPQSTSAAALPSFLAPVAMKDAKATEDTPVQLASVIPPLTDMALVQPLEVVEMRQNLARGDSVYEETEEVSAVLDKVVVAPKQIALPAVRAREELAMAQSPSPKVVYTIQVLAGVHRDHLERVIRVYHLEKSATIHETRHHGKPWYILTLGNFQSSEAAQLALSQLPKQVVANRPWVRQLHVAETMLG